MPSMQIGGEGVEVAANEYKVVSTSLNLIYASYRVGRFVAMASPNPGRGNMQVLRIKYYLQGGDFIRNP